MSCVRHFGTSSGPGIPPPTPRGWETPVGGPGPRGVAHRSRMPNKLALRALRFGRRAPESGTASAETRHWPPVSVRGDRSPDGVGPFHRGDQSGGGAQYRVEGEGAFCHQWRVVAVQPLRTIRNPSQMTGDIGPGEVGTPGATARAWPDRLSCTSGGVRTARCIASSRHTSRRSAPTRHACATASGCPASSNRSSGTSCAAGGWRAGSRGCAVARAGSTGSSRFRAKGAASVRAAVGVAWQSARCTWSITCCRMCPFASGSSRFRTRCGIRWPGIIPCVEPWSGRCCGQ